MAIMLPRTLPSQPKPTQGEKLLYEIFESKLPNNFLVWYEPIVDGRHPDFVILSADLGLLILEVKGWTRKDIIEANPNYFRINYQNDDTESIQNLQAPLLQARNYLNKLQNNLKKYRILTHSSGKYEGKLSFPLATGAVMSRLTREEAEANKLLLLLPDQKVIYQEELQQWVKNTPSEIIINRFREMFDINFDFLPLTEDQISTIKGVLYPEIVIREEKATHMSIPINSSFQLLPNDVILKTLDTTQESFAKNIGDGHRIFFGVSGSGKTLLLISRAKYLINKNPQLKILILCFNVCLASHLRSLLYSDSQNPQYQKINVMHFHDWAKLVLNGWPSQSSGNLDEYLGKAILEKLLTYTEEQKWDVILIDEAHTFVSIWFKCCVHALKDSQNGNLMIVADGNQKLYKHPDFKWKDVGIKAQGRTISKRFHLEQNYRNTREILSSALNVLTRITHLLSLLEDEDITFPIIQPSQALRQGEKTSLYIAKDSHHQDQLIISTISNLCQKGIKFEDIAVLYRKLGSDYQSRLKEIFHSLNQLNIKHEWVTKDQKSKAKYSMNNEGIKFITSLSSLGLEFKIVLFIWLEQFDDCIGKKEAEILAMREIYVGMTRAQNSLYLFANNESKLSSILKNDSELNIIISHL